MGNQTEAPGRQETGLRQGFSQLFNHPTDWKFRRIEPVVQEKYGGIGSVLASSWNVDWFKTPRQALHGIGGGSRWQAVVCSELPIFLLESAPLFDAFSALTILYNYNKIIIYYSWLWSYVSNLLIV